jgi:hypothetical protein
MEKIRRTSAMESARTFGKRLVIVLAFLLGGCTKTQTQEVSVMSGSYAQERNLDGDVTRIHIVMRPENALRTAGTQLEAHPELRVIVCEILPDHTLLIVLEPLNGKYPI